MEKQKYKLRHIALSVRDVAKTQKFLEDAFGMTKAGDAQNGIYMTDGTINIAVLNKKGHALRYVGR
jgi:lactoylglutathione lyase